MDCCFRTGKYAHASKGAAQEHVCSLRGRTGYSYQGEVYLCSWCRLWHVGTLEHRASDKVRRFRAGGGKPERLRRRRKTDRRRSA